MRHVVSGSIPPAKLKKKCHNSQEKHSDLMGSQRMSWRVIRVATISFGVVLLLVRGNLQLANASTNLFCQYIDAAYDCSMYYQLSNLFCLFPGQ